MNEEAEKIVEEVAEEKEVEIADAIIPEYKVDKLYEERGGEALRKTMETVFDIMKDAEDENGVDVL